MKRVPQQQFTRTLFLLVWLSLFGGLHTSFPQTTAFTYQGSLASGGTPATGAYDFQFKLFDAAMGGTQVGATISSNSVMVSNGVFTVALDFGASAFPGAARFLEIS